MKTKLLSTTMVGVLLLSSAVFADPFTMTKTSHPGPKGLGVTSAITVSDNGRVDYYHDYSNGVRSMSGYHISTVVTLRDKKGNIIANYAIKKGLRCSCYGKTVTDSDRGVYLISPEQAKKVSKANSSITHSRVNGKSVLPKVIIGIGRHLIK